MAERKVLNKYYPPDFDPALLPKGKRPKNGQVTVRVMLPMSIRCTQCGEWIYKGKKFNARKETVQGETYLGLEIYRFYIKCLGCKQEITFKTDPKNSDYIAEHGATRNFEPWRIVSEMEELAAKVKQDEELDAIKKLENRTLDNRREMAIADAIEEVREINARHAGTSTEIMIDALTQKYFKTEAEQAAEDEEIASKAFQQQGKNTGVVRRLDDIEISDDDDDLDNPVEYDGKLPKPTPDPDILGATNSNNNNNTTSTENKISNPSIPAVQVKVKKRKGDEPHKEKKKKSKSTPSSATSSTSSSSSSSTSTSTSTSTSSSSSLPTSTEPENPVGLSLLGSYDDGDSD